LIFSVAKDQIICGWFSANGERLGTFSGHQGAIWTVDVDPTTTLLASGAADNTIRLWEVKTGKLVKTWEFGSTIKRVEFSPDGRQLLGVTEKRVGHVSSIVVYDIDQDPEAEQTNEHSLRIVVENAKATVAGFSYDGKFIVSGHEDGKITQWDAETGEFYDEIDVHEDAITDLQWSPDRSYFVTSSKDKTAKLVALLPEGLSILKTYLADTPLNSAAITPVKDYIIVGGGQAAMDVTTTSARQGKFEARFYHKIFEEEIGRVRGHFGPLNYVAVSPTGKAYASGGEDGYVRLHHFDRAYFDFMYEVEREERDTVANL
jgi:translation initiation factor 3 subunit I